MALVIGVSLSRPLVIHYFHTSYFSSIIYEYFHLLIETLLCFRSLMQGRYSIHAPLLVKTLLHHFVSQEKAPPGLYRSSGGGSVVIGLASKLILGTCLQCQLFMYCQQDNISSVCVGGCTCVGWPCCTFLHGRGMCMV